MTIKQGGVFGRNPTFNTLTTQGSTNLAGPLTVNAAGADRDTQIGTLAGPYSFFMDGTNGAVGFGTNSVTPYFGTTVKITNASGGTIQVGSSSITAGFWAATGLAYAQLETVTSHDLCIATNSTERVRIGATSGNVTLTNGNLIVASGKGIDFSATAGTGTSELFSDYEEGTWTVQVFDSASSGTASPTTVTGYYTKVGQLVHCSFSALSNIVTTGMSGALHITLPFTAGTTGQSTGSCCFEVFTFGAGRTNAVPCVNGSATRATIRAYGTATSASGLTAADLSSGVSDLEFFSLTYRT